MIDEAEFNHMIGKQYRNDESVTVPGCIGKISDKAFAGNGETKTVTFEDGIAYIGNYAFSRCFSLTAVFIPTSVRFISHNAFWQAEKVTIHAASGSYAHNYARRHKIPIITE